jgi:hypothetical protein
MLKWIVAKILTHYNVAWVSPGCECPRSPDAKFLSGCPLHSGWEG